jgi:hypothetical protein
MNIQYYSVAEPVIQRESIAHLIIPVVILLRNGRKNCRTVLNILRIVIQGAKETVRILHDIVLAKKKTRCSAIR